MAKNLEKIIKEVIEEQNLNWRERPKTIFTTCPKCDRDDKFSIIKANGACKCYHGSCDFGRRWFEDWLSMTSGCSIKEARDRIRNGATVTGEFVRIESNWGIESQLQDEEMVDQLQPVLWPPPGTIAIDRDIPSEGLLYLESRGIPAEVARHYGIRYWISKRRVVIPVFMNGICYGWQARAIDRVEDGDRMRNNEDFQRSKLVMFLDQVKEGGHVITAEGPFDAMKFHLIGGNIATLGKEISDEQLERIFSRHPSGLYLALDEDAARESTKLIEKSGTVPVYTMGIPSTCRARCDKIGKKADFGECNFVEAKEAFLGARRRSKHEILVYLK